ncbi:uncharacterized protein BDR25DRAFT_354255 [Lindgomyces ingoldianus]|uniref:Uncharacterized protein n=1 Tax=Lindgomyces ingoldianus TaxID=673940 RepID=A0ACB6QXL5_9PLEO|nr:uncharacterized protein BDR25DRAFT_354255 [Lindgomyces ingoldianus]KAF2471768.1 hypothetical protein BDR25DRAFT_354255 [Lindgomyces ingoldianus]
MPLVQASRSMAAHVPKSTSHPQVYRTSRFATNADWLQFRIPLGAVSMKTVISDSGAGSRSSIRSEKLESKEQRVQITANQFFPRSESLFLVNDLITFSKRNAYERKHYFLRLPITMAILLSAVWLNINL